MKHLKTPHFESLVAFCLISVVQTLALFLSLKEQYQRVLTRAVGLKRFRRQWAL